MAVIGFNPDERVFGSRYLVFLFSIVLAAANCQRMANTTYQNTNYQPSNTRSSGFKANHHRYLPDADSPEC
jgi:hypothetical protein